FQILGDYDIVLPVFPRAWVGVRTTQWKYVEYITGEKELYSLVNDPYESHNLIDDSTYGTTVTTMAQKLATYDRPLAIKTANLTNPYHHWLDAGTEGVPYSFTFAAWGGEGTYSWSHYQESSVERCTGDLPDGLTLSASGVLSGTPTAAAAVVDIHRFCVQVSDTPAVGNAASDYRQFAIEILDSP
ncbi:MAG: putative Ig domain-containing protein, partial [Ardenticatenaceae bacterium]